MTKYKRTNDSDDSKRAKMPVENEERSEWPYWSEKILEDPWKIIGDLYEAVSSLFGYCRGYSKR